MKVYVLVLDPESNYAEGWAHVLGVWGNEDVLDDWVTAQEDAMKTQEERDDWYSRLRSYEEEVRT